MSDLENNPPPEDQTNPPKPGDSGRIQYITLRGPKGDPGDRGDKGERGDKRDRGDKGDRGEKGDRGDRGDSGGKDAKEAGDNQGDDKKKDDPGDSKDEKSDDKEGDKSKDKKEPEDQKPKKPPLYKRPGFIIGFIIAVVIIIAVVLVIWLIERQYVSTDDAYVDSHVVQVSPQIAARVLDLHIDDNQFVHRGDLLIQLDPTDYQVALTQAKAQVSAAAGRLAQSRAQIDASKASVTQAIAREHASQASAENAARDFERYVKVDERARSKQQLDTAATSQTNANADVEQARAQLASAQANVATSEASVKAAEGELESAQADQKRAEVNLSYCQILAPMDGRVTERTVEVGNYATAGQVLFMLVDPNVWVTANFKETQLTLMRSNQPVTIEVDAFPGHKFQGHVDSIQAGSGARFSVLPAENATGNYVKIVQRVPVKIVFEHDANTNNAPMLSPGLSVTPKVKVR